MGAQTPIKRLVSKGLEIYSEDWAGKQVLICTAADQTQCDWLTWTISRFHQVDFLKLPEGE